MSRHTRHLRELQATFADLTATLPLIESAARHTPAVRRFLAGFWWQWGHLGRQLTAQGCPPDPPVPHRLVNSAPDQTSVALHCWTCDAHLEIPPADMAGGPAAWSAGLHAFVAAHETADWEADR